MTTETPTPPAAAAPLNPWLDTFHKVVSGVLVIAIVGFWQFYQHTNAELAALRTEVVQMREKVNEVYVIVDAAFPRRATPSGGPL